MTNLTTEENLALWYYETNGERKGPVREETLLQLLKNNTLNPDSVVWKVGMVNWLPISNTDLKEKVLYTTPPPLSGKNINNSIVWTLAFAPVIGYWLELLVAYSFYETEVLAEVAFMNNELWFITLILNITLSILDERKLGKAGVDTDKLKGLAWLVPVYLYQRAKALQHSYAYLITWIVCFIWSLS
jgi:hypothetical protein